MNELIWIGNMLYPRWIVFAVFGLIIVALATIGAIVNHKMEKRNVPKS